MGRFGLKGRFDVKMTFTPNRVRGFSHTGPKGQSAGFLEEAELGPIWPKRPVSCFLKWYPVGGSVLCLGQNPSWGLARGLGQEFNRSTPTRYPTMFKTLHPTQWDIENEQVMSASK